MSTAANHPAVFASPAAGAAVQAQSARIPWYVWTGVLAITSSSIGGAWDVSWHRSIGRDTFWTPAHMAIQACGVLAGIICVWLIAQSTLGHDSKLKAASVAKNFWQQKPPRPNPPLSSLMTFSMPARPLYSRQTSTAATLDARLVSRAWYL